MFNVRKTCKVYIDFFITIFSLCVIVVTCRLMWALLQTAKLPLWLTLVKRHICTFASKKKLSVLRSLLKDWNYFLNKYCNLLFLAICCSQFPFWYFLRHPDIKKQKLRCEQAGEIKKILWTKRPIEEKMINCHFQGLHKITC